MESVEELLAIQSGVISRRQTAARGMAPHELKRRLRRKELVTVHPGLYVNHTGELTWVQRAWAAVLLCWPAALTHDSAARAGDGPGRRGSDEGLIHVAVDRHRHLEAPPGVRLYRLSDFEARVQWNLSPPRIRYDDAVLLMAACAESDFAALGLLAQACQSRRTTARRLHDLAVTRRRLPRRDWIISVLADIAEGACSVLEHGYLVHVERAHGLPTGRRQDPETCLGRSVQRDVEYVEARLIVELDGRLFHDSAGARDADFDRDLDAATTGRDSVRISWGQVFDRSCRTAERVGVLLQARGWTGAPRRCGPGCTLLAATG